MGTKIENAAKPQATVEKMEPQAKAESLVNNGF
jgi:hypothetical protein